MFVASLSNPASSGVGQSPGIFLKRYPFTKIDVNVTNINTEIHIAPTRMSTDSIGGNDGSLVVICPMVVKKIERGFDSKKI
jgi:hypothetical protein